MNTPICWAAAIAVWIIIATWIVIGSPWPKMPRFRRWRTKRTVHRQNTRDEL